MRRIFPAALETGLHLHCICLQSLATFNGRSGLPTALTGLVDSLVTVTGLPGFITVQALSGAFAEMSLQD
jgi:uncharacterized UPF0160 family protein